MNSIWDKDRISEGRKLSEMSAISAATLLNITPEYLSMLENGQRRPSETLISKMATLYRQPVSFFLKQEKNFAAT
jgi:transcriptional regulator with XRE-family HTH domain